jgi:hypothetical protein
MTKTLSSTDPNLLAGVKRHTDMQRLWGGIMLALGMFMLVVNYADHPMGGVAFMALGALCLLSGDPFFLAAVAVALLLSIVPSISPNLVLFGPDPIRQIVALSGFELVVLILGKMIAAVMALNFFLFYRFLYGTARAWVDEPDAPIIPEMIPNRTNWFARWVQWGGGLGLVVAGVGLGLSFVSPTAYATQILAEFGGTVGGLAVGIGFGVAFSPTDNRATALRGVALGALAYILAGAAIWMR